MTYRKAKWDYEKEERERITHILKIQRGGTSQYAEKKTAVNIAHQLKITEEIYQDTESRLEKQTHLLDKAKGELSGHRKGTSEQHPLSKEGRAQDWSGHGK